MVRSQRRIVAGFLGSAALAIGLTSFGNAVAAPSPVSTPAHRVATADRADSDVRPRAGYRQALRLGDDDVDNYLGINPACTQAASKAKPNAEIYSDRKVMLDYSLTGSGDLLKTGTVTAKKGRSTPIELPKVERGSYRLVLTEHGTTTTVADQTFEVLACVDIKSSCHAVTFTNPVGNPTASIAYGRSFDERFWIDLAGGSSVTARVDVATIRYTAYEADVQSGGLDLGSDKIRVRQRCKHGSPQPGQLAVQTSANVGCAASGTTGMVDLFWSAQPGLKQRLWRVVDASGAITARGSYRSGHTHSIELREGTYRYQSYANGLAAPFEELSLRVLHCVKVTTACRALTVFNPNAISVDVTVDAYDADGDFVDPAKDPSDYEVPAHQQTTIPVQGIAADVVAVPTDRDDPALFFTFASALPGDNESYSVPQDC